MIPESVFEKLFAARLGVLHVADEFHRGLVADHVPQLYQSISRVTPIRTKDARHHTRGSETRLLHKAPSPWYMERRRQILSSTSPQGSE